MAIDTLVALMTGAARARVPFCRGNLDQSVPSLVETRKESILPFIINMMSSFNKSILCFLFWLKFCSVALPTNMY